ncbi:PIN domain-containing protein [Paenarthrobacter ilicis]|uniref:PIN domain-containing protein n=1 Tax=Paenarthrobacter ilicis TaxID=43665 RepID=UPI003865219F
MLSLAFEGAYRFIFSEAILMEVEANEEINRVERGDSEEGAREKASHLVDRMRSSFGDSVVTNWEGLEGTYGLPDPDDEHVLAAAVVGGAGSIVTENYRDFPEEKIPAGIQVVSAKDFAFDTVSMRPDLGLHAGTESSPEDILDTLNKLYSMDAATALIRDLF